ncbi:MAG: MBL fold metallo-hydrolase [Caulobacter sp.]
MRLILSGLAAAIALFLAGPALAAADPCAPPPAGSSAGKPLIARFMGVSTVLLDDGSTQILFDGFFTRRGLLRSGFGWIRSDPATVEKNLDRAGIDQRLKAVFVAHGHVDHALDVPVIIDRHETAMIVGTRSVDVYVKGRGRAHKICVIDKGERTFKVGDFTITAISSPHGTPDLFPRQTKGEFGETFWAPRLGSGGENLAFLVTHGARSVLIHPSATAAETLYCGRSADVVFLGVGQMNRKSWNYIDAYFRRTLDQTGADLVIPIHWDNFGRSLDEGLRPLPFPLDNVGKTRTALLAFAGDRKIRYFEPPTFQPLELDALLPAARRGPVPCEPRAPTRPSSGD